MPAVVINILHLKYEGMTEDHQAWGKPNMWKMIKQKNWWWGKQIIQGTEQKVSFLKVLLESALRNILEKIKPKDRKETETTQKLLQIKNMSKQKEVLEGKVEEVPQSPEQKKKKNERKRKKETTGGFIQKIQNLTDSQLWGGGGVEWHSLLLLWWCGCYCLCISQNNS